VKDLDPKGEESEAERAVSSYRGGGIFEVSLEIKE
jgi:hypothetical protein